MTSAKDISGYHAHVYFDARTLERARSVCAEAAMRFGLVMGRMHEQKVGPHPMWSCQLAATPQQFQDLLPWLTLNRDGLIVFIHPTTGDDLRDHRDHGIWLGAGMRLDLTVFAPDKAG